MAALLNPRTFRVTLSEARTGGSATVPANLRAELGHDVGATFAPLVSEGDPTFSVREGGEVLFDLTALRMADALPEGQVVLAGRVIEGRPDLVTDDFPNGVDLLSAWGVPHEVLIGNPPQAPATEVLA